MRAWWSTMYDEVDDDRDRESNKMIIDDGGNDDIKLRESDDWQLINNNDYHDEVNDNRCRGTDKMIIDDGGNDDKWLRRWIILRRIILMINDVANNMIDD